MQGTLSALACASGSLEIHATMLFHTWVFFVFFLIIYLAKYVVLAPLPSELYRDASHPLAEGYKQLARQRAKEPFFRSAAPSPVGFGPDR